MKKYQRFLNRQPFPELELEDKHMPLSRVSKQNNSLRFVQQGQDNEVSAARTSEPLLSNRTAVYFEAFIVCASTESQVGVGLIHKDCALKKHPGLSVMSFGYLNTGQVYLQKKKIKVIEAYKSNSTVGIGIIYPRRKIFVTLNGKLLHSFDFAKNQLWNKFYPCISLRSIGDQIKVKFKDFVFNFETYLAELEEQCMNEIDEQFIGNIRIPQLVADYLKFYGYKSTLQKFKEAQNITNIDCFVKHPYLQAKITIQAQQQQLEANQKEEVKKDCPLLVDSDEEEIIIYRKNSTRQRIMSDYWNDMLPNESKKINEQEKSLLELKRKDSEPLWLQSKQRIAENEPQVPSQINDKTLEFLTDTRLKILNLIREQKVEEAYEKLKIELSQLFVLHDYLHSYFRMHVYLSTLKNHGAGPAITYMRNHVKQFEPYREESYPVFIENQSRVKFVSFTQMMSLISLKPDSKSEALSNYQFRAFSCYLNEVIMKSLGFYSQSRLDMLMCHIKCINLKNEQYHINGPIFTCDL